MQACKLNLDPRYLQDALSLPHTRLMDVRSLKEYKRAHIPSALHMAFWRCAYAQQGMARQSILVIYCGHGPRAWIARFLLRLRGFHHVYLLRGHMAAWQSMHHKGSTARCLVA